MTAFLDALYCLVFSECENEVEMMIFVAWSLLRVSCQNEQCFWVVLAPKMLIKQPTLKSRRVPKPKNDYIFGNGFLQHIFWCRGHIFLGVVCIDEKWWVLSLNAGKGRVYREESPISVGILTKQDVKFSQEQTHNILTPYYRTVDEPWDQQTTNEPRITLAAMFKANSNKFREDSVARLCSRPDCRYRTDCYWEREWEQRQGRGLYHYTQCI